MFSPRRKGAHSTQLTATNTRPIIRLVLKRSLNTRGKLWSIVRTDIRRLWVVLYRHVFVRHLYNASCSEWNGNGFRNRLIERYRWGDMFQRRCMTMIYSHLRGARGKKGSELPSAKRRVQGTRIGCRSTRMASWTTRCTTRNQQEMLSLRQPGVCCSLDVLASTDAWYNRSSRIRPNYVLLQELLNLQW